LVFLDGAVLEDDFILGNAHDEVQIIVVQDMMYSEETWTSTLLQYATIGDLSVITKALQMLKAQVAKCKYENDVGNRKTMPLDVSSIVGSVLMDYLAVPSATMWNGDAIEEKPIHSDVVRTLCGAGADLTDVKADDIMGDDVQWTPLCYALARNRLDIAQILFACGADAWLSCFNAIEAGNVEILNYAIHVANLDVNDSYDGMLPLYAAAYTGNEVLVQFLLDLNADVHTEVTGGDGEMYMERSDGRNPLHAAAAEGHDHICELLINYGSDVHHCDDEGSSALDLAEEPSVRKLLKRHMRRTSKYVRSDAIQN